jgi:hypothetical protein
MLVIPGRVGIPIEHEDVLLAYFDRGAATGAAVELLGYGERETEPFAFESLAFQTGAPGGQIV